MKRPLLLLTALLFGLRLSAVTVTYTPDNTTIFRNPERGFTNELNGAVTDSRPHLLLGRHEDFFDDEGTRQTETLVMLLYNLGAYRSGALSAAMLQGFDDDMQVLRDKGFKCVLRFAYTEDENDKNDAGRARVLAHIAQLKPHLAANADVIYVLEAGFVGVWGEWYYSNNFGNETQQLTADRRAVLTALLDACPQDRFLLTRYPLIKIQYFGDEDTLTVAEAFTGTDRARLGHHNDAFLNKYGNEGTYGRDGDGPDDDPVLRRYIAAETLYVPNGGETNVESSSLAKKVYTQAESEMSTYHWTFCGEEYATAVTDRWRSSGIFDNLNRRMGYRYQLISGTYAGRVAQGETLAVSMQVRNTGYAPLYNARTAYLVLRNGTVTRSLPLTSDPRRWLPNDAVTTISEQLTVPADLPVGTYHLYLHLPDAYPSLAADPRYAVRFANTGVWDDTTGMNDLGATVTVVPGSATGLQTLPEAMHTSDPDAQGYDLLGRPVRDNYRGVILRPGQKILR